MVTAAQRARTNGLVTPTTGEVIKYTEICSHMDTCPHCYGSSLDWENIVIFSEDIDNETADDLISQLLRLSIDRERGYRGIISRDFLVRLNSNGGSVTAGLSMIDCIDGLKRKDFTFTMHVPSFAASMATVLLQSANKRTINRRGQMLIHNIRGFMFEDKLPDLISATESWKHDFRQVCEIYAERNTKGYNDPKWWEDRIEHKEWYLTAQDALEYGLVDEVL